jgi:surfactin synthase thioesterase subunit
MLHVQMVHAWLPQLLKEHNVATVTATGHSLGGGLACLSAFDIAQHLEQNWAKWDKTGWKTQQKPQVRMVTFAPRHIGNAIAAQQCF